jgi:ATP-binding cassette subfamily B protein
MSDPAPHRAADRLLLRLLWRGGGWNWLLLIAGLLGTVAYVAFPAVLGRVIDALLRGEAATGYIAAAGALVALFVLTDAAGELAVTSATARATATLRHLLLDRILAVGPRRQAGFPPGDVTSRLVSNTAEAARITPIATWCVTSFVPSLGGLVALVLIDPLFALVFAAGTPVLIGLTRVLFRHSSSAASEYLRIQGSISARLVGALAGARTIAAAATQEREARWILLTLPDLSRQGRRMWTTNAGIAATSGLSGPLIEIAVLGVAGILLTRHRISPGEMVAASQYVALASGLSSPLAFLGRFARARAGAVRVAELAGIEPPRYGERGLPPAEAGRLELRDVTVLMDGQPVLSHLDLVVPAGTLLAVVGRSGAGKSMLAGLAGRLVDPDAGTVLLDGVPLGELGRDELRGAVSYGFDRPVLVGETVADAVALGCPASRERVASAATAACADDFIRRLPDGYATPLQDTPLSGGEAQRLGLARAFVRPSRVLVLDDATSNLDTITEMQIAAVLTGALRGRTRIVVAHRAGTASRADLVAWLDGGRVRRVASHAGLWRDPDYRRVFAP